MLLLAIETSCDETAAAVVEHGRTIRSSIVASQASIHAEYGGVVPEIASRKHMEAVIPVVDSALRSAGIALSQLDGIAVTRGPGLAGALLVGVSAARAMGVARGLPVVGVHHIEGHILAIHLEEEVPFPYLALAVSGGHTHLYRVEGIGRYVTLGRTIDDASGEAFDKVAKLLGLPYPGGVLVDRLAMEGDDRAIHFPRPLLGDGSLNFSFSGLKTAVLHHLNRNPDPSPEKIADICASFQAAVCEVLVTKTIQAARATGLDRVIMAGGVACNSRLRRDMAEAASRAGLSLHIPSPPLCADNAAMLAVAGDYYLSNRLCLVPDFDVKTVWPLESMTQSLPSP
jgi:N6-L-threonylcarbamoyladenine synthase